MSFACSSVTAVSRIFFSVSFRSKSSAANLFCSAFSFASFPASADFLAASSSIFSCSALNTNRFSFSFCNACFKSVACWSAKLFNLAVAPTPLSIRVAFTRSACANLMAYSWSSDFINEVNLSRSICSVSFPDAFANLISKSYLP